MFVLYCYDEYLDYYDWFLCRYCDMSRHNGVTDSYMLIPGTYDI